MMCILKLTFYMFVCLQAVKRFAVVIEHLAVNNIGLEKFW